MIINSKAAISYDSFSQDMKVSRLQKYPSQSIISEGLFESK
jgi:hypothetical protein